MNLIKPVVVFDLGNVIVKVDHASFYLELERALGFAQTDRLRQQFKNRTSVLEHQHNLFEMGQLDFESFFNGLDINIELDFFKHIWNSLLNEEVQGMNEILLRLVKNVEIFALSNTNHIHLSHLQQKFPIMGHFKKIFASHQIQARKPNPLIYQTMLNELNRPAKEVIFFDDLIENCEGAKKLGINAHQFTNSAECLKTLNQYNIIEDNI